MGRFLTTYDLLLTPTLIGPAAAHGVIPPTAIEEKITSLSRYIPLGRFMMNSGLVKHFGHPTLSRMAFTAMGNITGLPSMPLHWTEDGLPLGMLFTGRMCDETTMFRLAGQLEREQPWFDRIPNICM